MKPYRVFIGLLAVLVSHASSAMTLSPGGSGQVLLFPYYTVNKQQQTLLNVVNRTANGKAPNGLFVTATKSPSSLARGDQQTRIGE